MTDLLTTPAARVIQKGQVLRSEKITGLALYGNAKTATFKFRYLTKDGVERRPRLGTYPTMSIEAAERCAKALLEEVGKGRDPGGDWQVSREAATVNDLCDMYLTKYARVRKKGESLQTDERLIAKYVRPGIGKLKAQAVTLDDIETLLVAVHDRDPKFHADTPKEHLSRKVSPFQANRLRALLSTMFALAATRFKLIPPGANPVTGSIRWAEPKRRRFASADELPRIWKALVELKAEHPRQVAAIFTLFFTGARVSEIAKAETSTLRDRNRLELTAHKTVNTIGVKTIHLPLIVTELLADVPPDNSGYVFGGLPLKWVWMKARRMAGCSGLQLKDARRTFASIGLSDGLGLDAIGKHFGHTNTKTTDGYSWMLEDAKKGLVNKVADRIEGLMKG